MRGTRRLRLALNPLAACHPFTFRSSSPPSSSCLNPGFLVWVLASSSASIRGLSTKTNEEEPSANSLSSSSAKTKLIELLKVVSPDTQVQFEEKEEIASNAKKGYRSQVLLKTKDQFMLAYTGNSVVASKKASQHVVSLNALNDLIFATEKDSTSSFLAQRIHRKNMDMYILPLKEWLTEINEKTVDSTEVMTKEMIINMRMSTRKGIKLDLSNVDALRHQLQLCKNIDLGSISKCILALNIYSCEDKGIKELISELSFKLSQCEEVMTSFQVRDCMFGLRNMSNHVPEIAELLKILSGKFTQRKQALREEAGDTLYGLRSMDSSTEEVRILLKSLKKQIKGQKKHMKAYHIENAMYGLKNMSSDVFEVRDIIFYLTKQVKRCNDIFKEKNVGLSLYGLQSMKSNSMEVRNLVKALTDQISKNTQPLKPIAVGSCLYGLKGMNSKYKEIKSLLSVVSKQVSSCQEDISSHYIAMALYGLQNMSSDIPEVEEILILLTRHLDKCKEKMSASNIAMSLYGLRNMNSKCPAILELLKVLTKKIRDSQDRLNAQEIGNSFFGLQKMHGRSPEVRELVEALTFKAFEWDEGLSPVILSGQEIANALYGMQRMDNEMIKKAYGVLCVQLRGCGRLKAQELAGCLYSLRYKNSVSHVRDLLVELKIKVDTCEEVFGSQEVGSSLYGLCSLDPSHQEVRNLITALTRQVELCNEPLTSQAVGNSLYALRNMSGDYREVKDLFVALSRQFKKNKEQLEVASVGYPEGNLYDTLKKISMDCSEVRDLLLFLSNERLEENVSYCTIAAGATR